MYRIAFGACVVVAATLAATPLAGQGQQSVASTQTAPRTYHFTARYGGQRPMEGVVVLYTDSSVVTPRVGSCRKELTEPLRPNTALFKCDGALLVDDMRIVVNHLKPANSSWSGSVLVSSMITTDRCVGPIVDANGKETGCSRYATETVHKAQSVGGRLEIVESR